MRVRCGLRSDEVFEGSRLWWGESVFLRVVGVREGFGVGRGRIGLVFTKVFGL